MSDKDSPNAQRQLVIDALKLEYTELRQELRDRAGYRQQTLTVLGVAAGLVISVGSRVSAHLNQLLIAVAVLLTTALAAWFYQWLVVVRISIHLVGVEQNMNKMIGSDDVKEPLSWESTLSRRPMQVDFLRKWAARSMTGDPSERSEGERRHSAA